MNQNQLAELFDTSKQTISYHIINILKERELDVNSVVKKFFTTAADGKNYEVTMVSGMRCQDNRQRETKWKRTDNGIGKNQENACDASDEYQYSDCCA